MQTDVRPEEMARITTPEQAKAFIDEQVSLIKEQVGDKKVLLALSGGVDSSVVAALLIKAIGQNLVCVHVNHGFLRKGEPEQVIQVFKNEMNANLIYIDASERFLEKVAGVDDPEQKVHLSKEGQVEAVPVLDQTAAQLYGILELQGLMVSPHRLLILPDDAVPVVSEPDLDHIPLHAQGNQHVDTQIIPHPDINTAAARCQNMYIQLSVMIWDLQQRHTRSPL